MIENPRLVVSNRSSPKTDNQPLKINEDLINFTRGSNLKRLPYYLTKNSMRDPLIQGKNL